MPDERARLRAAGRTAGGGRLRPADDDAPDVVVFNTCAVRENADNRLYGNLGQLLPAKKQHPGMQIAVGGCLAQKDRGEIVRRAPWVDVVFGTHNIGKLPLLLERARIEEQAQVEIAEALEQFPSTLPTRRDSAVRRLGVDQRRLQQHLHVLHRAVAARTGDRPSPGRDPRRDRDAGGRRRAGDHPARPERQRVRIGVRRPAGLREAAARLRARSRAGAGPLHLAAPAGLHRRRDRGDGRDRRT